MFHFGAGLGLTPRGVISVSLGIGGAPVLTGTQGAAYAGFVVYGFGGTGPYAYSDVGASLPAGVTVDAVTGAVAGAPAANGTFNVTLRATDALAATADLSFTLVVAAGAAGGNLDLSEDGNINLHVIL